MNQAVPLGIRNVWAFPILTEGEGQKETYGPGIYLGPSGRLSVALQKVQAEAYGDDRLADRVEFVASVEATLDLVQMPQDARAKVWGQKKTDGLAIDNKSTPVRCALAWGFALTPKPGDTEERQGFSVLYRGTLSPGDEEYRTKTSDSVVFVQDTGVKGVFGPRLSDSLIRYTIREDWADFDKAKAAAWFTKPQEPAPVVDPGA